MSSVELSSTIIKQRARALGFDHCRILPLGEAPHADFFDAWLDQGRAGEMHYLAEHRAKRRNPALLAGGADPAFQSLIVLAVNYHRFDLPPTLRDDPSRGIIASYAWGDDYHEIIRPLLYELDAFIRQQSGRAAHGKCLVDTGPVLERDWAHAAGLGFTGKNCCTIHPRQGSWLLLATVLVPEVLAYDRPLLPPPDAPALPVAAVLAGLPPAHDYGRWHLPEPSGATGAQGGELLGACGRCTRCLAACPTAAFAGPYHLDPLRCIAYWTIEARTPIPHDLRPLFGNRIFGCDICQEVCPYNQRLSPHTPLLDALRARTERIAPPLLEGFRPDNPYWVNDAAFSEHFRRSPLKRTRRHGMLRNVCVALGNWAAPASLTALGAALHDDHPLPRQHAAWAIGQILARRHDPRAAEALVTALAHEADPHVQAEIQRALA